VVAAAVAIPASVALLTRCPRPACCPLLPSPPLPPPRLRRTSHRGAAADDAALPPSYRQATAMLPSWPLPPRCRRHCRCRGIAAAALLLPPCCHTACRYCPAAALPPGVLGRAWESFGGLGSASERLGEQVSMLVGELAGGEFIPWPSQTAFGGNRNPEESGGIGRNPVQIQEFLSGRNSCDEFL
jgi:hypothetical protein